MKEKTRQIIYSTLLGTSFLVAFPVSISCMLHSQDEDSALFRAAVSYVQGIASKQNADSEMGLQVENHENGEQLEDNIYAQGELSAESCASQEEMDESRELQENEILIDGAANEQEVILPEFQQVDLQYFNDALFIGDSRTLGIMEYGGLEQAMFFANSGMSVIKLYDAELKVDGMGKVSYEDVLNAKRYGKVYIMLGMNEMGYEYDYILSKYQHILDEIQEVQPDALIYVCANLHLTKEAQGEIINNPDLDVLNSRIAEFADNQRIFYLDINPYYDDGEGNLNPEYSTDGVHIYAKYYTEWANWLSQNAIVDKS